MSKIKHIHLFRNGTVLDNRDSAVVKLNEFINGSKYDDLDGVAILARYKSTSNGVQTLVGFVYGGDGTNSKSITIFDNEASKSETSTEINTLKTEIETQINNTLTSANTYTDEEIAKLDVDDSPVDNNFVTSVSESDGKITVQRAAVASPTKTVSVTKADGGGVNFDVNIDGKTIVKNTDGKISVAISPLVEADEPSLSNIVIDLGLVPSPPYTNPTSVCTPLLADLYLASIATPSKSSYSLPLINVFSLSTARFLLSRTIPFLNKCMCLILDIRC